MEYSEAYKYAQVFEILSNPYALIILDHLIEHSGEFSPTQLAEIAKTTESKVRAILEKLKDLYVVDKEFRGSEDFYHLINSKYGDFIEHVINKFD